MVKQFEGAMDAEPKEHGDLSLHYRSLSLGTNSGRCVNSRNSTTGAGLKLGVAVRRYLDVIADVGFQPGASPASSLETGGSLTTANFGCVRDTPENGLQLRFRWLRVLRATPERNLRRQNPTQNPDLRRMFHFSAVAALSGDVRVTKHLAFRVTLQQMLIRYKNPISDPDGIGTAPRLSFLSHDNYINSTNWGVSMGPVLRF